MGPRADASGEDLAPRSVVLRPPPQPTAEVLDAGPTTPVGAELAEAEPCRAGLEAFDQGQVQPCPLVQAGTGVERRLVGLALAAAGPGGQRLALALVREGGQGRVELPVAGGKLPMGELLPCDCLRPGEPVVGTPMAVQGAGHRGLLLCAAAVAELGEGQRSTGAVEDGLDDGHAGDPREVTDHLGALEVQPVEGLLPVLDGLARIRDEPRPRPQGAAPHADLVFGPEGAGEEAIGVQALEPLTVVGLALGPVRGALHLTGIDPQHLAAAALQLFEPGDPGHAGRFPGDGGDPAGLEPGGHGFEVDGEGAEAADGRGRAVRGDRDPRVRRYPCPCRRHEGG
jgi:hypothetical protein